MVTRLAGVSHNEKPMKTPAKGRAGSARSRRQQGRSLETQEKILTAAVSVLVDQGYSGASTLQIQQKAGVSRGRLLHHYPSREKLLSAAVHHLAVERMRELSLESGIPDNPRERIRVALQIMWSNYSQPYFWASNELWNAARTNPELRAELRPVEQRLGQVIRTQTDNLFGPEHIAKSGYKSLRELLLTSMRGVAMTYTFDPREPSTDRHLVQWQDLAEGILLEQH